MTSLATKQNVSNSLLANSRLSENVPKTRLYSEKKLRSMLDQYKMVYVKPNMGTGGKGVMRVEDLGQGNYKYQLQTTTRKFDCFASFAHSLRKKIKEQRFVIQQGIHLLRHKRRLFDLRVMVQKNPKGKWETTGVIGRLGHPKKIVTNVCRGGCSRPVEVLLKKHVSNVTRYTAKLRRLGSRTARQLNRTFPRIKELGFDIGIDCSLHPWILEANPRPAIYGFKTLRDKSIYSKMRRYQKAYRRT